MLPKIFICYRRDDAPAAAARLRDAFADKFGPSNIYMDIDILHPGELWEEKLKGVLKQCFALVLVVGPNWSRILAQKAQFDTRDQVRQELLGAWEHNLEIFPVKVGDVGSLPATPQPSELPSDMRRIAEQQWYRTANDTFRNDFGILARHLVSRWQLKVFGVAFPERFAPLIFASAAVAATPLTELTEIALPDVWLTLLSNQSISVWPGLVYGAVLFICLLLYGKATLAGGITTLAATQVAYQLSCPLGQKMATTFAGVIPGAPDTFIPFGILYGLVGGASSGVLLASHFKEVRHANAILVFALSGAAIGLFQGFVWKHGVPQGMQFLYPYWQITTASVLGWFVVTNR